MKANIVFAISLVFAAEISGIIVDLVDKECLGCLELSSEYKFEITCRAGFCGPYSISMAYWEDAGRPVVDDRTEDSHSDYVECVLDKECSEKAIQGYMKKFVQDCNADENIDCDDFFIIHFYGGEAGCFTNELDLNSTAVQNFMKCRNKFQELNYIQY